MLCHTARLALSRKLVCKGGVQKLSALFSELPASEIAFPQHCDQLKSGVGLQCDHTQTRRSIHTTYVLAKKPSKNNKKQAKASQKNKNAPDEQEVRGI